MKKMLLLLAIVIINTIVYSSPKENLLETKLIENIVKKEFKEEYSKISVAGKELSLDMEINLLEEDGIIKIIANEKDTDYKRKIDLMPKCLDHYFDNLAEMVKQNINIEKYKLNLIFVFEKGNQLITKKSYLM